MIEEKISKARTLVEALPYIKKFKGAYMVIKYGGSLMVDDELRDVFAKDVALLKYVGINPIIVHGGGKEISRWMKKVGKEAVFIDGLRFTDSETMELTEMVLSGKISNAIVSLINHYGGKAVGLSGKDADLFIAKKIQSKTYQDLGLVGDIHEVDCTLLFTLSEKGYIPVVSSIARGYDEESLNMNADHVAEELGAAISAEKVIYLTDVQGIIKEGRLLERVTLSEGEELLKHPDIKGGMIPKLTCSLNALRGGVKCVHIINGGIEHAVLLEVFTDVGIGTMLTQDGE